MAERTRIFFDIAFSFYVGEWGRMEAGGGDKKGRARGPALVGAVVDGQSMLGLPMEMKRLVSERSRPLSSTAPPATVTVVNLVHVPERRSSVV